MAIRWRMLCFILLFTSILICKEARPIPSSISNNNENHAIFMESSKQVLKEIIRRKQLLGITHYETNRLSPGGPDPHHH
ncbi:hypothetical protein Lalb_Chr25g0286011 [Lupinus albus]|uniref:Uncharacterized protein n=1 Tax=Lupinus albus TaxID=3870 RepID=A0A6A4MZR2_LUPAL|nr:hypothetical protein Lalb_Chr25g0286011 [Lupinus albus]